MMEIYNVCIGQNHADPLRQGPRRKPIQHSLDAVVVVYTCYTCILSSLGDENVLSKCSHEIDELEERI